MTDIRRTLLHTANMKPLFVVTLKRPDGTEQISNIRADNAKAAGAIFTTPRMKKIWGYEVVSAVPA